MSLGKFATGTVLLAPAAGGVGYVTYDELTKEKTEETTPEANTAEETKADQGSNAGDSDDRQKGEDASEQPGDGASGAVAAPTKDQVTEIPGSPGVSPQPSLPSQGQG